MQVILPAQNTVYRHLFSYDLRILYVRNGNMLVAVAQWYGLSLHNREVPGWIIDLPLHHGCFEYDHKNGRRWHAIKKSVTLTTMSAMYIHQNLRHSHHSEAGVVSTGGGGGDPRM